VKIEGKIGKSRVRKGKAEVEYARRDVLGGILGVKSFEGKNPSKSWRFCR